MNTQKHRVLVVGCGIGAVRVASLLAKDSAVETTLISPLDSLAIKGSIYRTKSGRSKRHIRVLLDRVFTGRQKDIDLVKGATKKIDADKEVVILESGIDYAYDSLILAVETDGLTPAGVQSAQTYSAYKPEDLARFRRAITETFEQGAAQGAKFVIGGGGEIGVVVAAELARHVKGLAKQHGVDPSSYKIILVEQEKALLRSARKAAGQKAHKQLKAIGVYVSFNKQISGYSNGTVRFSDGISLKTDHLLIAAGRQSNQIFRADTKTFLLNRERFVRTTSLLEAEGHNNIYVIGDNGASEEGKTMDTVMYEAEYVVHILQKKRQGRQLPNYEAPARRVALMIGPRWGLYDSGHYLHAGISGYVFKRWYDLEHFSTLLPKRLALQVWLRGSKHDELQ